MAEIKIENIEELEYANQTTQTAIVKAKLNVREAPSKESKIIKVLESGEEVGILEVENEWVRIQDGYCMKEFLEL